MKLIKLLSLFAFALVLLSNCTLFKKNIIKPVVVAIPDTLFIATLSPNCPMIKYLSHSTVDNYAASFFKGFKQEAKNTKNITLTYSETGADFVVKVKSITLTETSRLQTINDPKSMYNGRQVELNSIGCTAELEITDVKKSKKLNNCSNSKTRSEEYTNNRNLDDLINGRNKDNTAYHTRLLNDNICMTLSQDVGRRIWVPITRRISGDMK